MAEPILVDLVLTEWANRAGNKGFVPPYGLALLAGQMPQELLGRTVETRLWDEYCDGPYDVVKRRPDVVMISSLTPGAPHADQIGQKAMWLEGQSGEPIRVIRGGIHATVLPNEALRSSHIVVRGELTPAFQTFVLERALKGSRAMHEVWRLRQVPSIIRRPPARWDKIDARRYCLPLGIQTAVGCPMGCPFCSVTNVYGAKIRQVSEECLRAEIANLPPGMVAVYDDNFLPTNDESYIDRSILIAKLLHETGHTWAAEVTLRTLQSVVNRSLEERSFDLLEVYYRYGCRGLFFGIEKIPDKQLRKSISVADSIATIQRVRRHGIPTVGSFMMGISPEETVDYADELVEFMLKTELDTVLVGIKTPLPGSADFLNHFRNRTLLHRGWEYYKGEYACFRHPILSPEELEWSARKVVIEFYRARHITNRCLLPLLWSWAAWRRRLGIVANLACHIAAERWRRAYAIEKTHPIVEHPLPAAAKLDIERAFKNSPPRLFDVRDPYDGISNLFDEP